MLKRLTLLIISCFLVVIWNSSYAQFPYYESFKDSFADGVIFGGTPNSALLTSASGIDAPGAGYLRLTDNGNNQTGFARSTRTFASAEGLDIRFEYYTYGGSGADGITFFLFDAVAAGSFQIGGFGGSLGYAQRADQALPGVSKGYLGIALDEFGNFSNPLQGRVGGPAQQQSSVTLRGDGDGMGSTQEGTSAADSNYEYLTSIQTSNSSAMNAIGAGTPFQIAGGQDGRTAPGGSLDDHETGYRRVRILLEPLSLGYKINVYLRVGGETSDRHLIVDYPYISTVARPDSLSFGFSSATGGANNYHEVRSLDIRVPSSVARAPFISDLNRSIYLNSVLSFSQSLFFNADYSLSNFVDPNGDGLVKIKITSLPEQGTLKLNGEPVSMDQEITYENIGSLTYAADSMYTGSDGFSWNAADHSGLYAESDARVNIVINAEAPVLPPPVSDSPDQYKIRIRLNNPSYASYTHAENPYNKSLVSIFQVDDSPKTIYNLMYPYLRGGTTAGGYLSNGIKSTDGCGNELFWNISAACFIEDVNGNDLLDDNPAFISWQELGIVTANGPGFQRGFDFTNHGFGGSAILQRDRYQQIYLNNKAVFDHLGFHPEALVVPDVQIGYRFGANDLGMDVTSQAGVTGLWDGMQPLSESASAEEIYAVVQSPYFIRRNHWQEVNNPSLVAEHKSYVLAAYNKSLVKPGIYNWFSHGPGEAGTNNFAYYREVISYLQELAGDNVIGLSMEQYLGYQKTRYAAEHGAALSSELLPEGYLDITFDMAGLQNIVRHRLLSILISSDAEIEDVSWSENIQTVSFNPVTGLINILLNEAVPVDPATEDMRPVIIAGSPKISEETPNKIEFQLDRPVIQTIAAAYTVNNNTVLSISEVQGSGGLKWVIECENDFLATDVVELTYRSESGDATDTGNGRKMLTYFNLPVVNLSLQTPPEVEPLAISIRRDMDNIQLATFNTIPEVITFMNTFNFNTDISIVFNHSATYSLPARWTLNYNNGNHTLTIKGKDGLDSYPMIDCGGSISDPLRVAMSHIRIKQLRIRSGKYTADGAPFGDNYSGALISQQAGTSDCQYTYLELHQGMRGIRIGGPNGTVEPNISDILIDHVVCTELTGIAIQVGILSTIAGEPENRTDASYTLNNVIIRNVTIRDSRNQETIEGSGAMFYGQIHCRGVNHLTLQDIDSDQNQKQPFYIVASKNVLIERCKATAFSLNTGTGFKAAFQIDGSDGVEIRNSFAQSGWESLNISGSRGIRLYHNTFDNQQANVPVISMSNVRQISDIQGNLIIAKGDALGRSCLKVSFYRGAGYIPAIETDFISEKNNLFISSSYVYEFYGLGAANSTLTVRRETGTTFANYQTSYSRGQHSQIASIQDLIFTDFNDVYGYLDDASAGRGFVSSQIADISTDLANIPRTYPTDAGAYHRGEVTIPLFPYSESFKNSTAAGMIFGGSPPAMLTSGNTDPEGEGYLRLTSNAANQTGFARNTIAFPSAAGLSVSFDYYTYGGSGADGLTFFLYDASVAAFNIGGFGGSLGYAQNNTHAGISKAFIGMGLDEFGNFSNPTAQRQGGPGFKPSSVVLRGDGDGNAASSTNYEYLTGIQTSNEAVMTATGAGSAFQVAGGVNGRVSGGMGPLDPGYRRVKINLDPNEQGTGFLINVWITEGHTGGGIVHHVIRDYEYIPTDSIPAMLSYGFSAGTGGMNNFHEVRNLEIKLPEDKSQLPVVAGIDKSGAESEVQTFVEEDFVSKFQHPEGGSLSKIRIVNLPAHGTLKLNEMNVAAGQEINTTDIPLLLYLPHSGYTGSDTFQWNGSDGAFYALSPAYVHINMIADPVFPYLESFRDQTADAILFGGAPSAFLTGGNLDPDGQGYLRLTSNAPNQKGFVRSARSFPMAEGLSISFDYFTWGGNGADGISFFLYDPAASPFTIGGFGGSLGYAQSNGLPGVSKAYIGLGLDEFGNFGNPTASRQGGPGQRQSSLTLRGDGDGNAATSTNYEYLTGIQTSNAAAMDAVGAGAAFQIAGGIDGRTAGAEGLNELDQGYRRVRFELRPNEALTGFILNVWITTGSPEGAAVHHLIKDHEYIGSTFPSRLGYGFAGSTGGATNFHEIRNLSITIPEDLELPLLMTTEINGSSNSVSMSSESSLGIEDTDPHPSNVLTPNGDGKNDTWVVENITKHPDNSVRIFDSNGRQVFSKINYENDWDGTFNGSPLPEGTYFYLLETTGSNKQFRGFISIIR